MKRIALAAAVLLPAPLAALVSAPHSWLFLHPFVFVLPFWVFSRHAEGRVAFALGWAGGTAVYLALFPWLPETIVNFSKLPIWLGALGYVSFAATSGLIYGLFALGCRRVRRSAGAAWPIGIAVWFTACEFCNPQVIPFYQSAPWVGVPSVFLIVSLLGMSGGTFLVVLANAVVLQGIETLGERGERRLAPLAGNAAALVAAIAIALTVSQLRTAEIVRAEAAAARIRVAIVQNNVYGAERRAVLAKSGPDAIADDLVSLSRQTLLQRGPIDVFVWGEGALAADPSVSASANVLAFARESGAELWTGAGYSGRHRDSKRRPFNSAFRIDGLGRIDERYDKISLIPFGEYVPLRDTWPALGRIRGLGRYLPGTDLPVYAGPARFSFLICYEAIVPGRVRETLERGAELLVNITYDGWFGDTAAPHQHLMLVAAQSAQFGVPVVRAATTGISAFIDARGVIRKRSGLFSREVLVDEVPVANVPSTYAAHGDWFAWLCVLISAALLLRSWLMHPSGP